MIRRSFVAALLVLASACSLIGRPPGPQPTPTPTVTPTPTPIVGMTRAQAEALIVPAYRDLLFRAPDPYGLEFYSGRLMDGRMTDATMRADIIASPEYKAIHAPPPTPTPTPTPIVVVNGKIPAPVLATIRLFASVYTLPRGDGSEPWLDTALRGGWMKRLAEQLRFTYGPNWGQKRRSMGAPVSAGAFAFQDSNGMHVWDILVGTATGAPTLSEGEYFWVTDQMFWPVEPVDHLNNIRGPTDRPSIPVPFTGLSSFDLAPRVVAGDLRWIDLLERTKLTGRMFVYANGSGSNRLWRDADTGLTQTEVLLKLFVQRGLKGTFVILCGTGSDGWTAVQALDFVRRANALFIKYPSAILALQIGNENSHGIEAPYMTDATFLAEADALIDKRFPLAWGAGHGGEGVSMAGGSYLVHHADRALSPDENGAIMATAQRFARRPLIDDEPLGIAEVGRTAGRQRTDDPEYARRQLDAMRKHGLAGSTLHIDAGLTANVDELGPVQRKALEIFSGVSTLDHQDDAQEWQKAA